MSDEGTQASANPTPSYGGVNLFQSDPLLDAATSGFSDAVRRGLGELGAFWGSHEAREFSRLADRNAPELVRYDPQGRRVDQVLFHPAYHALMRRSVMAGLHCSAWDRAEDEAGLRHRARATRIYITAQTECGHLWPMSMTNAALASLRGAPELIGDWGPRALSRTYDQSSRPAADKRGVTLGLGLTEKQGGDTDVGSMMTRASRDANGLYRLNGRKWFLSAPMADAFLLLATVESGPTAFLLPRVLPDGTSNAIRLERLKDKLGNRSNATAEAELHGALAWRVGGEGEGVAAIPEAIALTRLDGAVISTGLMRAAFAETVHRLRQRHAFGKPLIDRPLMLRVLSDMGLDLTAALALSLRLAEAFDMADAQPAEAAYARLMTPAVKYWVGKSAPAFLAEAIECFGGDGYVEESALPRLYREAPANSLWDAPGNTLARDTAQAARDASVLAPVLDTIAAELGPGSKAAVDVLAAAASVSAEDEGSARILTEQLALTAAAAALRRDFPTAFADGFIETRLGRPWRSTYGMIDGRFDSRALVDYIAPQLT